MSLVIQSKGADVLADVLDSMKLRGRLFCRCELSAPWALAFASGDFSHFHVIERGRCWLRLDGDADPLSLADGDLLLLPRGRGYQLSDDLKTTPIPITDLVGSSQGGLRAVIRHGGLGVKTKLICGSFEFRGPGAVSFLAVLPQWIRVQQHVRHANEWLDATMRYLSEEAAHPHIGAETIIGRLIDVMFVEAVRTWLKDQPEGAAGWLGALRDPAIGTALALIHAAPEKSWTLPSLAAEVGMSRSPFAARFKALVGNSPMNYLKDRRMLVAANLLQTGGLALSTVAERVGYDSGAAFSRAFTRIFGVAPGQYRRAGETSDPESSANVASPTPARAVQRSRVPRIAQRDPRRRRA
jgi:AraC-like DNA-binding protein